MSRRGAVAVTLTFLIFIAHALVLGPLFYDSHKFEILLGRRLTDRPPLGADDLLRERTYQSLGRYLGDRFPFRPSWTALRSLMDLELFNQNPAPEAVVVADDWFYIAHRIRAACPLLDAFNDDLRRRLSLLSDASAAADMSLRLLVLPQKSTFYTRPLRGLAEVPADQLRCLEQLGPVTRQFLADEEAVVDTSDDLTEASPDAVYYRKDTHLTTLGMGILARELVESLSPGLWDRDALRLSGSEHRLSDLYRLMGILRTVDAPLYNVKRHQVRVTEAVEYKLTDSPVGQQRLVRLDRAEALRITDDGHGVEFTVPPQDRLRYVVHRFRTTGGPVVNGHTVVIHDSNMWSGMSQLVPYFRSIDFIHLEHVGKPVFRELVRDADRVVIETGHLNLPGHTHDSLGSLLLAVAPRLTSLPLRDERAPTPARRELAVPPIPTGSPPHRAALVVTVERAGENAEGAGVALHHRDRPGPVLRRSVPNMGLSRVVFEITSERQQRLMLTAEGPGITIRSVDALVLRPAPGRR